MYKNYKIRKVILGILISGVITTTFGSVSFGMAGGSEDSSLAGVQALGNSGDRMVDEGEPAVESAIKNFEYENNETGITITKYKGNQADVVIPSEINGRPVTQIGVWAFIGCESLVRIKIPTSVKNIAKRAFMGCESLKKVKFAEGSQLKSMDEWTFVGCTSLKKIKIPAGIKSIAKGVFSGCESLREIKFEEDSQLENIGSGAFADCESLEKITIPTSVKKIDEGSFARCTSLKEVTFEEGSQLKSIDEWAFIGCELLENIEIPAGVDMEESLKFTRWILVKFNAKDFKYEYTPFDTITILEYKSNKADVTIPSEINGVPVTEIGVGSFCKCTSLERIKIPASVKSIRGSAFDGCELLSEVIFEEGSQLIEIGGGAFANCTSLQSITIPAGVTSIEKGVFAEGTSVEIFAENMELPEREASEKIEIPKENMENTCKCTIM